METIGWLQICAWKMRYYSSMQYSTNTTWNIRWFCRLKKWKKLAEKQNNLLATNKAWSDAIEKNGYVN